MQSIRQQSMHPFRPEGSLRGDVPSRNEGAPLRLFRSVCCLALFATLLSLMAAGVALAATNVSGVITADTAWTAVNGPYIVTADATIDSGARLTIEAGVTVYMNAGTNLILKSGTLSAQGTTAAPITITSYRDIANPNPPPSPGDWGQLRFLGGTVSAATSLNNVLVKYGSGISLQAASPSLNNLQVLNHNGAAIIVDLQSSPVGTSLTASGNTINGILVPAGDIAGVVRWGLVGIPYVVAEGVVSIGVSPISVSPPELTLAPGELGTLRIALGNPAPPGGLPIDVVSSLPTVASVPTTVTIPAASTTIDLTVTALALGSTMITASRAGLGVASAGVLVTATPLLTVAPAPIALLPDGINHRYALVASNPSAVARVYTMVAANPSLLRVGGASVTMPAGGVQANFVLAGLTTGITQLLVTAPGSTQPIAYSALIGPEAASANVALSAIIGISKGDPAAAPGGTQLRALAPPLGLAKGDPTGAPGNTQLRAVAPPVGLAMGDPTGAPGGTPLLAFAPVLGLAKGDPSFPPPGQAAGPVIARPLGINRQ